MRIRVAVPEAHVQPHVVDAVLEAVTRVDEDMIRKGSSPTSHELIAAGAIWRPENPGDEHFDHGGIIASRGWGDCDDWAPLHAATLRASGEDPGAIARVVPSGPNTYHAIVERSDGAIEDPSIAAGMKAHRTSGIDGETLRVQALDPHDGRIYEGSLLPTVGPLSLHSGVGLTVRGCHVVGAGPLFEARCDLPLNGSPLVAVRSYARHRAHHRRRAVHGGLPYAISCTSQGRSPYQAISGAICGAVLCGDAAELATSLDRYKLLAVQAGLAGASPGQVRDALTQMMLQDVHADAEATQTHPIEHTTRLLEQLAQEQGEPRVVVGDIFSDIAHVASGVVDTVKGVVNDVAKAAGHIPWGDIVHDVQAAVSVVPGIGTAVSDVIAAAETAYDAAAAALSGNPLEGAIKAAYNFATATIPGASAIRIVLDPVVDSLLKLTLEHEPVESVALNAILDVVPDSPKFGDFSPRTIASSISHLIVGHLGVKTSKPGTPVPAHVQAAVQHVRQVATVRATPLRMPARAPARPVHLAVPRPAVHPALHAAPALHLAAAPRAAAVKPPGVPHAAVHVATVPILRPGSPGAPAGATHWTCTPRPGGTWQCRWV